MLWWLFLLGLEAIFWLNSTGRLILLALLAAGTLYVLFRFVFWPLLFFLGIKTDVTERKAAELIGSKFPEVGDRLRNLIDLSEDPTRSELLLASIQQRSEQLSPYEFYKAVDYDGLKKYLWLLLIPLFVVAVIGLLGISEDYRSSYKRVLAFEREFEKPAPFTFKLLSELELLEGEPLILNLRTPGKARPEQVNALVNGVSIPMKRGNDGGFSVRVPPPLSSGNIRFQAGTFTSKSYALVIREVPVILNFEMEVKEPDYLGGKRHSYAGTGNATVPEGSMLNWKIQAQNAEAITFKNQDSTFQLEKIPNGYKHQQRVFSKLNYAISTTNRWVSAYESLEYTVAVIPDEKPELFVSQFKDSLEANIHYFEGVAQDDHGIALLRLRIHETGAPDSVITKDLLRPDATMEEFFYTFPSGLNLQDGKNYTLWFEAIDNDGLRGGKVSRSRIFEIGIASLQERKEEGFRKQSEGIQKMQKGLDESREAIKALEELRKKGLQKEQLNYREQEQLGQLLKAQEKREEMMQRFSREMKKLYEDTDQEVDPLVKERLERREQEAEKNAELLKKLRELGEKISKENLQQRLEELSKKQSESSRDLQQLLELTKRYYVKGKMRQLAENFEQLAKEQLREGNKEKPEAGVQVDINERTQKEDEELDGLLRDNKGLKKPYDIPEMKGLRKEIQSEQEKSLKQLQEQQSPGMGQPQKKAGEGLSELAKALEGGADSGSGAEALQEDAAALRQILDNLVIFSFNQEALLQALNEDLGELTPLGDEVRKQQKLKTLFEHIDDSLFTLSLRRPEIGELVNKQVTEVYYNMEKGLESLAEGQKYQGASYQQFALTAANVLADFLANLLENMQQELQMGQGSGQEGDFQLPDIIKSQEALQKQMEGKGQQSGKEGEKGGEQGQKQGSGMDDGEQGDNGKSGNGKDGDAGSGAEGTKNGQGKNVNGTTGENSEMGFEEVYAIYMEQQRIRKMLEKQLEDLIKTSDRNLAQRLIREMEQFERQLIENGITQQALSRMDHIQQQLWKLEDAAIEQGEKEERESEQAQRDFKNVILTKPADIQKYTPEIEDLRRQVLPLRRELQERVKVYFKVDD